MTKADEFVRLWHDPSRSCLARSLIAKIDPGATKAFCPGGVQYTFTDGSAVFTRGRGWKILKPVSPESLND